MRNALHRCVPVVLAMVTWFAGGLARANLIVKSGGGTSLSVGADWIGGAVPGSGDVAAWNGGSLGAGLTLQDSLYWYGIAVSGALSDISLSGSGTIVLGTGGIDLSASPVNFSLANPILLGTNQTWSVNGGETLTISQIIQGGMNVTVNGAGTLVLSADNPMTGLLTVNGGTVLISGQIHYNENWQHLNTLTVNTGATVAVSSGNAEAFLGQCNYNATYNTINGGVLQFDTAGGAAEGIDRAFTIGNAGGVIQVLNSNATVVFNYFSDPMQFTVPGGASLTLAGNGNGVMNKIISGYGGLTKAGGGVWSLNESNNYAGPTVVSNGTLLVNGSIWNGGVTVEPGGTLGGWGFIPGNVNFLPGAAAVFTNGLTLTCGGTFSLSTNTVHLGLANLQAPGSYLLATYSAAGSTGQFNPIPVIDSGSLAAGCSARIKSDRGSVTLVVVPPPGPHLAILEVNGGTNATAGTGFAVTVQAQDANNNPLTMATATNVSVILNSGYGTLGGFLTNTIPAGSDSTVISGVTYSLDEGDVVITATNSGGTLLPGDSSAFTVNLGPAATLTLTSDGDTNAAPGAALPSPFIVTVADAGGNPVPGGTVTFAITGAPGGATGQGLSVTNATTDTNGAAASTLTLGDKLGVYTVTATLNGTGISPVVVTGTATNTGWAQVWGDEFNYNGLPDGTKWGYENGFVRNAESQYYTTDRLANASVANGLLAITARKETYTPPGQFVPVAGYTSASLITLGKEGWTYGRIEMRAKLPQPEGGVWTAFWMQGTNEPLVGWPACGELDIAEFVSWAPTVIAGNAFWGTNGTLSSGKQFFTPAPYANFHYYAMEWTPDKIDYYYENTNYFTVYMSAVGAGPANPFRNPQYILLNFALGGTYGGKIYDPGLPQQFLIDYVRVYQRIPAWTGSGTNRLWSTAANWTNGVPPKSTDTVVFTFATNVTSLVNGPCTEAGIMFYAAAGKYAIGATNGGTLTLTQSGVSNYGTNGQTLNVPIVLAGNQRFTTDPGALTIGGPISGVGFGLDKTGAGMLTLLGANTYTGATTLTAGTLALGQGATQQTSGYDIAAGATLDVSAAGNETLGPGVSLEASGTGLVEGGSAAALKVGFNNVVSLNGSPIQLLYDGVDPALYISQGTLSLSNNLFTINTTNGQALPAGIYPVVVQASGNVLGQGTFPAVGGNAIGLGQAGAIVVSNNTVNLMVTGTVTLPAPVTISPPVILPDGTVQLGFAGGNASVSYRVQVNDNLASTNWVTLFTNVAGANGLGIMIDVDATNTSRRFYRTVTP